MEDNSLPIHTTIASTNSLPLSAALAAASSASNSTTMNMDDSTTTSTNNMDIPLAFDQRLAFLQEIYQRKHAELLTAAAAATSSATASSSVASTSNSQNLNQPLSPLTASNLVNNEYLQSLIQLTLTQQAQQFANLQSQLSQENNSDIEMQSTSSTNIPQLISNSSSGNGNGNDKTAPSTPSAIRNRRTLSGSGSTISQHTRDRLKNMIATKKQKQQRLGSSGSSSGSQTNLTQPSGGGGTTTNSNGAQTTSSSTSTNTGTGSLTWIPPNNGNDLIQQLAAAAIQQQQSSGSSASNNRHQNSSTSGTSHFEPYPLPSSANNHNQQQQNAGGQMSEFQLRKVNSEPNLKMRLRARLLNKGSSPIAQQLQNQQQQQQQTSSSSSQNPQSSSSANGGTTNGNNGNNNNNPFLTQQQQPPASSSTPQQQHRQLQRCDSDSLQFENLLGSPIETPLTQAISTSQLLPLFPANLMMMPSPSLPNLCHGLDQLQIDYTNFMLQSALTSFLSMPSLLKNQLIPNSISDPQQQQQQQGVGGNDDGGEGSSISSNRPTVKFDSRTLSSPLPIGGYPSLLKQQLRDLVLRRKSLVREEPEDEQLMESINQRLQALSEASGLGQLRNSHDSLKTGLAYDAAMSKHQCLCGENQNHVEHGGRVHSIWARLQECGLVDQCERISMKKASLEMLKLVHSPTYVTFFAVSPTACLKLDPSELPLKSFVQLPCGGIGVDSDTYFNDANTQLAIRVAVGSIIELSTQVIEGKIKNGFACIRPPGHHAEREQAMGFCYFNNVSIATKNLQTKYSNLCEKIAIIDWDVHHGNGTQLCFESDPSVLYISLHRHDNGNFFPGTGAVTETGKDAGKGYTVNIPFSGDIMGDPEYLAAWRVIVLPLLDSFKPDFIFVSAGFDATKGHSAALGGYELSPQIFGYFTKTLLNYANGRVVLSLEGGYDLPSICDSAEECVNALCGDGGDLSRLNSDHLEAIPNQAAQDTIQKVIAIHKTQWSCLTGLQGLNASEYHWQTISQRFSSLTVHS